MRKLRRALLAIAALVLMTGIVPTSQAETGKGIVSTVVNSPLSAAGTVRDAKVGINVYLQNSSASGMEFMDPAVIGYGIPAGGRMEVELAQGFERDWDVGLSQAAVMLVTGAPQQGLPGKAVGYKVGEGENENTFTFTPTSDKGIAAETLMSPAPGAKGDPIRQRGIKVIHVGFRESAFTNRGERGLVVVRFIDGAGKVVSEGSAPINFLKTAAPQILPTNLSDKQRNHNWQRVKSGDKLGVTPGTVPVAAMLYAKAEGVAAKDLVNFKEGIVSAGVLSTPQLKAMGYSKPAALARYNGGLIVQDTNGDGQLDPAKDLIIGGVIAKAPKGAKGQELKTLEQGGKLVLSKPAAEYSPKAGKRFGGAVMQLQFTAGSLAGKYRPTLALLNDPKNPAGGDSSHYTYTIVVE